MRPEYNCVLKQQFYRVGLYVEVFHQPGRQYFFMKIKTKPKAERALYAYQIVKEFCVARPWEGSIFAGLIYSR